MNRASATPATRRSRPVTQLERLAKWARRKPTLAATYALALLAVLLGGLRGTAMWQWRTAEQARNTAKSAQNEAERQRDRADIARMKAQAEAELQREKFERFDYGRTIEVAHQEWRENNVPAALALLDSTRPDLRNWEWRYVHRLCNADLLTLIHNASVYSASFSPDGSRVATGSLDKTANVWDAKSGAEVLTLKGHTGPVISASFSPDGTRVVTASWDDTAKVWDAKSGVEILTLKGHGGLVNSASFSHDGARIVTGSDDGTAKIWDSRPLDRRTAKPATTPR
jgi:hypothetical protein